MSYPPFYDTFCTNILYQRPFETSVSESELSSTSQSRQISMISILARLWRKFFKLCTRARVRKKRPSQTSSRTSEAYGFPHELTKSLSVYTLSRVLAKIVPRPGLLGPSRAYSSESQRTLLEVEFSTCRRKRTVIIKCKDYELIVSWGFLCRRTYDDSDGNQVGSGQGLERTD